MLKWKGYTLVKTKEELVQNNLKNSTHLVKNVRKEKTRRGTHSVYYREYSDNIVTFDSETFTLTNGDDIIGSTTVCFTFCLNKKVILVRTPNEVLEIFDFLHSVICNNERVDKETGEIISSPNTKLVVYVQNLHFDTYYLLEEFQPYMSNEFMIKTHLNKYTLMEDLEFRCSRDLTGMSLASACKEYNVGEFSKAVGKWDYKKARNPLTKLIEDEIDYALLDVICLAIIIERVCEVEGYNIGELPVGSTGFTKTEIFESCIGSSLYPSSEQKRYRELMKKLKVNYHQFADMKAAFWGGIASTNPLYANKLMLGDIGDWDQTSQYPSLMATKLFPMSEPIDVKCSYDDLLKISNNRDKGFITRFKLYNMELKKDMPIFNFFHYSEDDSLIVLDGDEYITRATELTCTLSSVDFNMMLKFYDFTEIEIIRTYVFDMALLPNLFVKKVLEFYSNKTIYKGDIDHLLQYNASKRKLNSVFGNCGRYPLMDEYEMKNGRIIEKKKTIEEEIEAVKRYNDDPDRFYYYLWAIFTTAYGRENLCNALLIVKDDYICCDTDSVKFNNASKYNHKFKMLNIFINNGNKQVSSIRRIEDERFDDMFNPINYVGERKPLGSWENDSEDLYGICSKRPKCYIKIFNNKDSKCTVAGINGSNILQSFNRAVEEKEYDSIIDAFTSNMKIPAEETGKLSHVFQNNQKPYQYTDYQGNSYIARNRFAVHLVESPFEFFKEEGDFYDQFLDDFFGRSISRDLVL